MFKRSGRGHRARALRAPWSSGSGAEAAPIFLIRPSILGSAQVGQALTGIDGAIARGMVASRRWLLGGTVVSTAHIYIASAAGSLVYEVTATGDGGTTVASSATIMVTIASGNGAQITSPAAVSQFGATQRYFQARADRTGTWSKGVGGDAASFTLDATTGIYSASTAAAGDGSAQLTRTLPLIYTPDDGTGAVAQTVTVTFTPVAAAGSISFSYEADLSGPAGTPLQTRPGWAISGTGASKTPVLDGNGGLTGRGSDEGSDGSYATLYTPSAPLAGSRTRFTIAHTNDTTNAVHLMIASAGVANGIIVGFYPRDAGLDLSAGSFIRQAGQPNVPITTPNLGSQGYRSDGTADVIFTVSADGSTGTLTFSGGGTNSVDIDLSGLTLGPAFGFAGAGAYQPAFDSGKTVTAIGFLRPAVSLTLTSTPSSSTTNAAVYGLSWTGIKPTGIRHRAYDSNGTAATDWLIGDATIGNDGSISYTATVPGGGPYTLRFQALNDTPAQVAASSPTAFLVDILPFTMLYNVRDGNADIPIARKNNWGLYGEIQGNLFVVPPGSFTTDAGQYDTVETDGVMTGTNHATLEYHDSPSPGVYRVRVNGDTGIHDNRGFTFSTPATYMKVTRGGRTGEIANEFRDGLEGFGMRDLDSDITNTLPTTGVGSRPVLGDRLYRHETTGTFSPYQDVGASILARQAVQPSYRYWWKPIGIDYTDQMVRDLATYWRDSFPQTMIFVVERGNESPWNIKFSGARRTIWQALLNGYYGNATLTQQNAPIVVQDDYGYFEPSLAAGMPAFTAGHVVGINYSGHGCQVYTAKQNVPPGTDFANTTYWENVSAGIDMEDAARMYAPVQLDHWLDIIENVFGPQRFADQVFPVAMGINLGADTPALSGQFDRDMHFVPGHWDRIRGCGHSWYFSDGPEIDPATCTVEQIHQSFMDRLPAVSAQWARMSSQAIALAKTPSRYEGGACPGHEQEYYVGGSHYNLTWDAYMASDQARVMMAAYAAVAKQQPGLWTGYDLAGSAPWSMKTSMIDTTSKRAQGWREGLAA